MEEKLNSEWDIPDSTITQEDEFNIFLYNKHNESIFDDYRYFPHLKPEHDSVVKFDQNNEEVINHATLKALIVQLTSPEVIDYNLICDFFLTYRLFTDSHTVMSLLLTRLIWSLQYVNSFKDETERTGKLVLLRTFVVLRHWILNYFIDDFQNDFDLCDTFSTILNRITGGPTLIRSNMVFELKIITDLKTHWSSQFNEFFDANIAMESIYENNLPMVASIVNYNKLTKSTTDNSIHTNPSYRRSAMLSLYDNKTHHKCLIFNESNSNDENPQLSINNLLAQHKSSRTSLNDKLRDFHSKVDRKDETKPGPSNKHHAHKAKCMHFTDSSLALKKTAAMRDSLRSESKKDSIVATGFSTNGQVKLPNSKISYIVPPTPVKKMEYTLKDETHVPIKRKSFLHSTDSTDVDGLGRKVSIKKFMEGWKKSFNSADLKGDKTTVEASGSLHIPDAFEESTQKAIGTRIDTLSARIIDELEYIIRNSIVDNNGTINEDEDKDRISQADVNVENLSREPTTKSELSKAQSCKKKHSDDSELLHDGIIKRSKTILDHRDDVSIQDVSELNIEKIDNIFSQDEIFVSINIENERDSDSESEALNDVLSDEDSQSGKSSFRKVTSINWNDEGNLDFENSASLVQSPIAADEKDNTKTDRLVKRNTQYFDVSSDLSTSKKQESQDNSSVSFPSDIDHYNAEIADLSVAMSPQSMKRTAHKISFGDLFNTNAASKRFSMFSGASGGSLLRRDSAKSYLSYDSALSTSSNLKTDMPENSNLRKKNGYQNLRKLAKLNLNDFNDQLDEQDVLYASAQDRALGIPFKVRTTSLASRSSSTRKSVRFSVICALTELPFNDCRDSVLLLNNTNSHRKLSEMADSSVFSSAEHKSSATKKVSGQSSASSVAIPGISSYVLKELASIPDEKLDSNNPVKFALYKLEGKDQEPSDSGDTSVELTQSVPNSDKTSGPERPQSFNEGSIVCKPQSTENLDESYGNHRSEYEEKSGIHDTEEILAEINNAATEDAIEYSSEVEKELRDKPVTPIKTRPRTALNPSLSTPNMNAFLMSVSGSENTSPLSILNPKVILDGYSLTSKYLSVEEVMEKGSHVSFVLSYKSKDLAEHFTVIERDMLQEIDWRELVELQWNKDLSPINSWLEIIVNETYYSKNKGVNLVISRFNLMVNWIISEILLTKSEEERRMVVSRFIHVAYHCLVLQNFASLMQIILALTSEKVTKLKQTWNALRPGDILTLKNLEEMTSPLKNFINIRLCTNQVQPSRGCIPFVGLYLSDLIFNAERPKYVKKPNKPLPIVPPNTLSESFDRALTLADSSVESETVHMDSDRLINFSRFRTSVHIVKSLSQCIEWSKNYNFSIDDELLSKCLYIKSLDEEEMNYCLKIIEHLS